MDMDYLAVPAGPACRLMLSPYLRLASASADSCGTIFAIFLDDYTSLLPRDRSVGPKAELIKASLRTQFFPTKAFFRGFLLY